MSSQQEFSKYVTSFYNEVVLGRYFCSYSHIHSVFPLLKLLATFLWAFREYNTSSLLIFACLTCTLFVVLEYEHMLMVSLW